MMAWNLNMPMMETVARMKPRSWEPTSPMKILAGFRLKGIKPRQAPVRAARIRATFGSDTKRATTSMVRELMADTPTASPSSPSIRFTALVQPTIHSTVSGTVR